MHHDVHEAVARYLRIPAEVIRDDQRLRQDLGLDAVDLVTIVLGLEEREPWHREFPVVALEHAETVGDLAELYWSWTERETIVNGVSLSTPAP